MDSSRLLECLGADYRRMREVVPGHLADRVPTCPDWTVADLVRHVGQTYLHKVEIIRRGQEPAVWPPPGFADAEPVGLLDHGYRELNAEFTARKPQDPARTWDRLPDQTVGFWLRRMAQETVMHRIDAELGSGAPVAPVPDDLAVDGVDEMLFVLVGWAFMQWHEDFDAILKDSPGRRCAISAATSGDGPATVWLVRTSPGQLLTERLPHAVTDPVLAADAAVSGTPAAVLRWIWSREAPSGSPDQASSVQVAGDAGALDELRRCVAEATY